MPDLHAMRNDLFLRIGLIQRAHGVHGAVTVLPLTDDPVRFKALSDAFLERNGTYAPVLVKSGAVRPDDVVVQIEGVDTRDRAEALRGQYLCVDRQHAVALPADTYFVCDLIGCEASDTAGRAFGRVTDVLETGANDVYEIEHGKLMVPALRRVLHRVDVAEKKIVFDADVLEEVGLFAD